MILAARTSYEVVNDADGLSEIVSRRLMRTQILDELVTCGALQAANPVLCCYGEDPGMSACGFVVRSCFSGGIMA